MKKLQVILSHPSVKFLLKVLPFLLKRKKQKVDKKDKTIFEKVEEMDKKSIDNYVKTKVNERARIFWFKAYDRLSNKGFNPLYVFVHIYHETGGFKHIIGKHNYWGIKARKSTTNKVKVKTHEYINGERKEVYAYFRDWLTLEDALDWYMSLIKRLYPSSYKYREVSYIGYFRGLIDGMYKYATDPTYIEKLINLFEHLTKK